MDAAEVNRRADLLIKSLPAKFSLEDLARQGDRFRNEDSLNNARIVFNALMKLTKRHARSLVEAGVTELAAGNYDAAVQLLQEAGSKEPKLFAIPFNLGNAFQAMERLSDAIAAYTKALELAPDHGKAILARGSCYWELGRQEEALADYRRATALPKFRAHALSRILHEIPQALTQEDEAALRAEANAPADSSEKATASFALGEYLDRAGDYDGAFHFYTVGNNLRRKGITASAPRYSDQINQQRFDRRFRDPKAVAAGNLRLFERLREIFTAPALSEFAALANHSEKPVFVVGLPRSGSTLIEQVLAAHSKVGTVGESGELARSLVSRLWPLGRDKDDEAWVARGSDALDKLSNGVQAYLSHLESGAPAKLRCIDKNLHNFWYVGLILNLYPKARIIHSYRNPMDQALGMFRIGFARGQESTFDLEDIAALYRVYRQTMAFWEQTYPGRILHQANEDLAINPEDEARKLVAFCGLEWEEACLRFHEANRVVRTASKSQVRQPISAARLARWKNYEKHLAPFAQAVGPDLIENWRVETWGLVKSR